MTREEAIRLIGWLKCTTNREDDLEAIDMAIEALSNIETDPDERGYATGRAEHAIEAFEDEKRRNEQLYKWAYEQGAMDALAKAGVMELDDLEAITEKLKEED